MTGQTDEPTNPPSGARDPLAMPSDIERDQLAVRGGVILTASRMGMFLAATGSAMVLARLLTPAQFGIFAMGGILFELLAKLRNLGLTEAIIQRNQLDEPTICAVFWAICKINLFMLAASIVAAPLMAMLFDQPVLTSIIIAVAVISFIRSLSGVHEGLLRRQVRFKALVIIDAISVLTSIAVAIAAAYHGMGVWSLVFMEITRELLSAVLMVALSGWIPKRGLATETAKAETRAMTRYGLSLSGANLVSYIGNSIDQVLIGVISGARTLGLYDKAATWSMMPFQQIYLPTMKVAMSKFSRLQGQAEAYRKSVQRTVMTLYCVVTPVMALLFIEARAVILVLLGDNWVEVIPLFRILLIGVLLGGMVQLTKWIFKSEGRTGDYLRWTFVVSPCTVVAVCIGAFWGATGIALAYVAVSLLLFFPTVWFCTRKSALNMGDILLPMWAPVTAAILSAATTAWIRSFFDTGYMTLDAVLSGLIMAPIFLLLFVALPAGKTRLKELHIAFEPLLTKRRAKQEFEPLSEDPIDHQDTLSR